MKMHASSHFVHSLLVNANYDLEGKHPVAEPSDGSPTSSPPSAHWRMPNTEVTLLPSMHFGSLYSVQPDGKKVFLTTSGKLVCEHGEHSSTICHWISLEKKAEAAGQPKPQRGGSRGASVCDCQSTEGLNVKLNGSIQPPTPPPSLFEFLEAHETELVYVKGRAARNVPHMQGPMFVTSVGRLCCRHGASRRSLLAARQRSNAASTRLPTCKCTLGPLPLHTGLKGVRIGKFERKVVLADVSMNV